MRASGSSTARDAAAAQRQIVDYMGDLVDRKISDPSGDDVISRVAATHLKAGEITRDQLVAHAFLLLVAGNATVARCVLCLVPRVRCVCPPPHPCVFLRAERRKPPPGAPGRRPRLSHPFLLPTTWPLAAPITPLLHSLPLTTHTPSPRQ